MKPLSPEAQAKMEELSIKHNEALRFFENASFDSVYKNGFRAGYAFAREEERARAKILITALDEKSRDHAPYGAHDPDTCDACIALREYLKESDS